MTTLDTSAHLVSAAEGWGTRLSRPLERLARDLVAWREARATRKALRRLSAHELDDIGLTRSDVEAMAWRR